MTLALSSGCTLELEGTPDSLKLGDRVTLNLFTGEPPPDMPDVRRIPFPESLVDRVGAKKGKEPG